MKFYGNLDFNDNQSQNSSLEVESSFPLTPIKGRVVFSNKRVWICTQAGGSPIWVPLGPSHDTHVHTQTVASSLWHVEHNFVDNGDLITPIYPIVQVYDDSGEQIIPEEIIYVDDLQIDVQLSYDVTGTVVVMYGGSDSAINLVVPTYAYEHTQTSASTTWVVRHWLGYVPTVRVFSTTGDEIQPLSITVDDSFQVTIRFTSATAGTARII